ncbi:hypothetical protein BD410DRAFT_307813 [Rickenella mellea]|uniref:Uncharacterized protein n=1 Tax=Rickenella mellea TaxID=50990 RepID=A0A4Y7Q1A7_9AGAM|nr:hypothetical protein BD410DRAFT_307813 [Rickenella mellea]
MKATLACRMKDGGVALILPGHDESIKVYREDLLYGEDLQKYCFDQRDDCLQQLAAAAGPEVGMDDLIFVTGVYNIEG